jgi:hypothetical protein
MRKHSFAPDPFECDGHFTPLHPSSYSHLVYLNSYLSLFLFIKSYSCRCCGTDMVYEIYVFFKFTVSFFFVSERSFPSGIDNINLVPLIFFVLKNYILRNNSLGLEYILILPRVGPLCQIFYHER